MERCAGRSPTGARMSRRIHLGDFANEAGPFNADLDIVLRSNVLLQANSGGGKSWALRRCIEQAFARVPQIIIDPEGEFSTLRGKFDVVLVGKGGDTPADIRSAKLLAHRLLELGASAVIDLFEVSKTQRPVWVAAFVNALVDAPKNLWRDLLVYVDEAHEFAPEPGHGTESRDEKACRHALIDLASKGRKRGYGVIAATQRLGKLSKDFAAELKNVLIGQTFIDIDRERAAGNLGVAKANKPQFFKDVMKLTPGSFFAFGRAFVLEPTLVTIGGVQTEHPEAGRRQSAPPPPTAKIRHLLPQLADLPKEAEESLITETDLRSEISRLKAELSKRVDAPKVERVEVVPREVVAVLGDAQDSVQGALRALEKVRGRLDVARDLAGKKQAATAPTPIARVVSAPRAAPSGDAAALSKCARSLLAVLAQRGFASDSQISALSGYRKTSSGFANALSELRTRGLIDGPKDRRTITESGRDAVGPTEPLPTGRALLGHWLPRLGKCEAAMLRAIFEAGTISRDDLSTATGYSLTSSGFANGLSGLRVLDLVHGANGGDLTIADVFSDEAVAA
jgi:uncharacterized protein DUF87